MDYLNQGIDLNFEIPTERFRIISVFDDKKCIFSILTKLKLKENVLSNVDYSIS